MNRTFKVVGRYFQKVEDQRSWYSGKPNTQAKKRVYTSKKDFDAYSPDLISRWEKFYQVEVYELINDKWEKVDD